MGDVHELDVQKLPLDAWHRAHGGRMVSFAGYSMPIQYEGILAEHVWTRDHAGLFDVSHMGQLVLSGDDVAGALEALLPGDIQGLGLDRMRYSLLLNGEGGIIDDLMVTRRADDIYMVVNGATKHGDIAYMRERLPAGIALVTLDSHGLLALQGPGAVTALSRLVPGVEKLTFMTAGLFGHGEHPLWISRSGYTGEDGFEISLPAHSIEMFATLLAEQPEVKPIGLGARDSLRLEAGLPLYGHDLDTHINPAAADLGFAVSKRRRAEGGFPAADTILRELAEGAATKRVGFAIEGRLPAREGAEIFAGDAKVGTVTSGGFAPTVGAPIAMGFVEAAHAAPGTTLHIEVRGKRLAATVTPMPFVPHRYVRKGAPQ
ncbi:glycine cleavage system aminomethyltransferase GcvT [uncultured Sphingomonas sp.]|uniref:glycine cleavage system aminomethyltransferase GcvT n=1 Tax=uncultured Sphingomonas sp. TaxID=158754 RepID=UPI0025CE3351|nr:glycine cleavage system aminomethyltransferase GcvT [uncultured Sphingomonas sp.]